MKNILINNKNTEKRKWAGLGGLNRMRLKEKGREAVGSTVTPTQAAARGGESVREGV